MAAKTNKKDAIVARVTVQLSGTSKKHFFEEVERTGITEAKLARKIITEYYSGQGQGKERFF
jgi:hypothetical protein